jgi:hypothetical protein
MIQWLKKLFGYPTYLKPAIFKQVYRLRIWKLGSLEHKILPTEQAIETLATKIQEMLDNWDGKSDLDLIWGPELTVETHPVTGEELNVITKSPNIRIIPNENGEKKIQEVG